MSSILEEALQRARGRRPQFTSDPLIDQLFAISVGLATELAVTRQRLDTLERVLSRTGQLERRQIESFEPTSEEAAERGELVSELLAIVFRALLQSVPEPPEGAPAEGQATRSPAA